MSYSPQLIDHYENPRNVGSFAKDAIKAAVADYKAKYDYVN
jgi:NifU-like protein involved in Fe-S cluster formation